MFISIFLVIVFPKKCQVTFGLCFKTKESKVIRENALKDTQAKVKTRSKTLAVLSKEENLQKLRNLVENANGRMTELTNQWKQVQTPLLEEYQSLHAKEVSSLLYKYPLAYFV